MPKWHFRLIVMGRSGSLTVDVIKSHVLVVILAQAKLNALRVSIIQNEDTSHYIK